MLKAFQKHMRERHLFDPGARYLLAISGGSDSVVLAHLLQASKLDFALAHCNFHLRGKDSEEDEFFCKALAKELGLVIHTRSFDMPGLVKKTGQSIQMAARQLRYDWFQTLLVEEKFSGLVTAHHADDAIETVFINLLRGTGIKGMKGIPEKTDHLVRPLLPFTKTQLLDYAKANGILYRTDTSNQETKYERNFLRLKVIPLLKKVQPELEQVMLSNLANFKEEAGLLEELVDEKLKSILEYKAGLTYLDKNGLQKEPYRRTILHTALSPLGFNTSQIESLDRHIERQGLVGKVLQSSSHTLTIDRQQLVIRENKGEVFSPLEVNSLKHLSKVPFLGMSRLVQFATPKAGELVVDSSRLIFPLIIRSKGRGDRFKPFGMQSFKLISDFLKDQKLNSFEKEKCKLLVNGNNEIIWVLGYRSDERYRVKTHSADLITLKLIG